MFANLSMPVVEKRAKFVGVENLLKIKAIDRRNLSIGIWLFLYLSKTLHSTHETPITRRDLICFGTLCRELSKARRLPLSRFFQPTRRALSLLEKRARANLKQR